MAKQTPSATTNAPKFVRLGAKAVAQLIATEPPLLLDVREDWEFALGHLPGAQLVPLSKMPSALADLAVQPGRLVVAYCHHGVRSQKAAAMLLAMGHAKVASMDGGIDAWATEVDASVGRY